MMESKKQIRFNNKSIISASEIGQYVFCSVSWYLQRCGIQPDSFLLEVGKKTHINLGDEIDSLSFNKRRSTRYALFGYLFLIIALIFVFFEVVL